MFALSKLIYQETQKLGDHKFQVTLYFLGSLISERGFYLMVVPVLPIGYAGLTKETLFGDAMEIECLLQTAANQSTYSLKELDKAKAIAQEVALELQGVCIRRSLIKPISAPEELEPDQFEDGLSKTILSLAVLGVCQEYTDDRPDNT